MRDSQRSKLYAAEREAFVDHMQKIELDQCVEIVERVFTSKRVKDAYDPFWTRRTIVDDGRGCRRAISFGGRITLPKWSRMKWVVLHEMAHEIRAFRRKDRFVAEAAHGWQYTATYLDLVMWFMGSEAHDKLKAAFRKHKVKFSKPRTGRVLSAEEKQVLRDRLAAARAAKAVAKIEEAIYGVAA